MRRIFAVSWLGPGALASADPLGAGQQHRIRRQRAARRRRIAARRRGEEPSFEPRSVTGQQWKHGQPIAGRCRNLINAPLRRAPRPRPRPPLGPMRHANAGATSTPASAPLVGLGIHGYHAWSRRSARFKRTPEAPWRDEVFRHQTRV